MGKCGKFRGFLGKVVRPAPAGILGRPHRLGLPDAGHTIVLILDTPPERFPAKKEHPGLFPDKGQDGADARRAGPRHPQT